MAPSAPIHGTKTTDTTAARYPQEVPEFSWHVHVLCYHSHMSSATIIKRLQRDRWRQRVSTSSHRQFTHPTKPGVVTVPHPRKDIAIGTLRNIYRQAGWEWDGGK